MNAQPQRADIRRTDFGPKNKKQKAKRCARVLCAFRRFKRVETRLWLKSNHFVYIFYLQICFIFIIKYYFT